MTSLITVRGERIYETIYLGYYNFCVSSSSYHIRISDDTWRKCLRDFIPIHDTYRKINP